MRMHETNGKFGASELALQALAWALMDEVRAERLLALTGLTPERLRAGIHDRAVQAAILTFLENHEPDLMACATILDVSPADLVAARKELEA
jgi:Protein of unknown function (DUF3572)